MSNQQKGGWGGFLFVLLLVILGSGVNFNNIGQRNQQQNDIPTHVESDTNSEQSTQENVSIDNDVNKKDYTQYGTSSQDESDDQESEVTYPDEPMVEDSSNSDRYDSVNTEHDLSQYTTYNGEPVLELAGAGISVGQNVQADFWPLDRYGRPTGARATLSQQTMRSSEGRPGISIDPPGFKNRQYYNANGKKYWLYNRSHLIAYTLYNGDTEVRENLVTGTQQLNQVYMTQYEDEVRKALRNGEMVEYQVEAIYRDAELIPRALALRMRSSKDTLDKTVILYNVQEGVSLNYATGESQGDAVSSEQVPPTPQEQNNYTQPMDGLNTSNNTGSSANYKNCTEAREAGVTPLYRGEPGYHGRLDRDNDGIACE